MHAIWIAAVSIQNLITKFLMKNIFLKPPHILEQWDAPGFRKAGIQVNVLRGDLFDPWIQGNKWYKLRYYAEKAKAENAVGFVSIGGPWSNHLIALGAYAADNGLQSHFLIRGAESEWQEYPAVKQLQNWGAVLIPVSRTVFRRHTAENSISGFLGMHSGNGHVEVPLGASSPETIFFVAEWAKDLEATFDFSDLVLPVASGGTCAGFLCGLSAKKKIHAIDVLNSKGKLAITVDDLIRKSGQKAMAQISWHSQFDFGGYAAKNPVLENFRQALSTEFGFNSEHVYSAKAFFAVSDLAEKGAFSESSNIMLLHTGGIFSWNS